MISNIIAITVALTLAFTAGIGIGTDRLDAAIAERDNQINISNFLGYYISLLSQDIYYLAGLNAPEDPVLASRADGLPNDTFIPALNAIALELEKPAPTYVFGVEFGE